MVRCNECGFLAVRDEYDNSVGEADGETRAHGEHRSSQGNKTCARLKCYRVSPSFPAVPPRPAVAIAAAIGQEIDCPLWRQWSEGKTPQEHEQMSFAEIMELRQKTMQLEAKQQADERERRMEERHALEFAENLKHQRATRRLAIAAMIVSLVVSIAAAVIGQLIAWRLRP